MPASTLLLVGAGAAAGAFVSGVSGFAYGLVALSLWSWQVEPRLLAPMVIFGSLAAQLLGLRSVGHRLEWRAAVPLAAGGIVGIPIGVALLDTINLTAFRLVVGLILVAYAATALFAAGRLRVNGGSRLIEGAIGVASGVMGGLAGLHGGLPALWATLCGWSKERQRSVFQAYNTTMAVIALAMLVSAGKVGADSLPLFAVILPATLLSTWLGTRVYRRLGGEGFRRIVLALLLCSGLAQLLWALMR